MRLPLLLPALLLAGCTSMRGATNHPGTDWTTDASAYRGQTGQRVAFDCPPNPGRANVGPVWGAEVYTDDSAVCAAAVHAGKIAFERGGRVVIEVRPGQASYRGTDWNGVVSEEYGDWDASFVFVGS
jgi:hypothetical protein